MDMECDNNDIIIEANAMSIDNESDRPITSSNRNFEEEIEFQLNIQKENNDKVDNRPLDVRLGDKNWKTRLTAYEDLKTLISVSSDQTIFEQYGSWLTKMTSDSNAGALDIGVDCCISFIDRCPDSYLSACISNYSDKLYANVVDKAFNSKPSTLNKGKALLMKIMEVDEPTSCTLFLLSKLTDKKPKIPPTCLEVIKDAIIAFGAKPFPIKDIISNLAGALNSTNSQARENAISLLIELVRWIGNTPFLSLIDSLRPAQKSEIEKLISEIDKIKPIPSIYLRKLRPSASELISQQTNQLTNQLANDTAIDSRQFLDEIDLIKKLKGLSELYTCLNEEKWSEQMRGLTMVIDAIGPTPKFKINSQLSDYLLSELIPILKTFMRPGHHIQVELTTIKLITLLADGMRTEFNQIVKPMMSTILNKVKEKKLVNDVEKTIIQIIKFCFTQIDIIFDESIEILKNKKNPVHSKLGILNIFQLLFPINSSTDYFTIDQYKQLIDICIILTNDSDSKIRELVTIMLSQLLTIIKTKGKPANELVKTINSLEINNNKLYKKITSSSDNIAVKDSTNVPETVTTSKTITKPIVKKSTTTSTTSLSTNTSSKLNNTAITKKPTASNQNADLEDTVEELSYTYEDSLINLSELLIPGWEDSFQTTINSAKWQEKVEGLGLMSSQLISTQLGRKLSGYLVVYLSKITNGFKITNVNVLKAVIQVCCDATDSKENTNSIKFNKAAGYELIKNFGDKLVDKKVTDVILKLLNNLSNSISNAFVISRMKFTLDKIKAPATHQIYLEWLKSRLADQGANSYPLQFLSTFCQIEIENKVASVRTAAIEVLGEIYHQIGPKSLSIIISESMKPQIKQLLENEFTRVGFDPNILASKATTDKDNTKSSNLSSIPRVDLMNQLDKNIILELNLVEGKNSWINRKNALEVITNQITQSGFYLEFNKSLLELVKSMKLRLLDTQSNLKPVAALALGYIVLSLETESACKIIKLVIPQLLNCLTDNKKQLRDAAIHVLDIIIYQNKDKNSGDNLTPMNKDVAISHMSAILPFLPEVLLNSIGRSDLLPWLITNQNYIQIDSNNLIIPLFTCFQDKISQTRSASENLTIYLVTNGFIDKINFEKGINSLTIQQKRFLQPFIDKIVLLYNKKSDKKIDHHKIDDKIDTKIDAKDIKLDNKINEKLVSPKKSIEGKIPSKLNSKSISQLVNQVDKQLTNQLNNNFDKKLDSIVDKQSDIQLDNPLDRKLSNTVESIKASSIDKDFNNDMIIQSNIKFENKVYREVDSEIDIEIDGKIDNETFDVVTNNPFTGIFADITNKLDDWLNSNVINQNEYLTHYVVSCDYMKLLHEIAIDRWIVDGTNDSRELIKSLGSNVEYIFIRLLKYIFHCFTINQLQSNHSSILGQMDRELDIFTNGLSICLSTLFQLLSIKDIISYLSNEIIEKILSTILICLSDNRLTSDLTNLALSNESKLFISNTVKALNVIALRLSNLIYNDVSLISLLHVLLQCALTEQINSHPLEKTIYLSNKLGVEIVPSPVSIPTSKLVLHILSNEVTNTHPFDSNTFNIKSVLLELHEFYQKHPLNQLENDQPFRCSKTIINEIVKSLGASQVMDFLQELSIPLSSYVYKITAKLGHIAIPNISPDFDLSIVSLIDEITSSSNKYQSIQKLYYIMKENPGIDISVYLSTVSVAFRRYILDTLDKIALSNTTTNNDENINYGTNQQTIIPNNKLISLSPNVSTKSNSNLSSNQSNFSSNYQSSNGDEAMRILDGLRNNKPLDRSADKSLTTPLKSRSENNLLGTPSGIPTLHRGTTPRAAIQDRVRGSLNTLSMQLDLQSTKISRDISKSFLIDESLQYDDPDLNSRINKLKNFNR